MSLVLTETSREGDKNKCSLDKISKETLATLKSTYLKVKKQTSKGYHVQKFKYNLKKCIRELQRIRALLDDVGGVSKPDSDENLNDVLEKKNRGESVVEIGNDESNCKRRKISLSLKKVDSSQYTDDDLERRRCRSSLCLETDSGKL